MARVSFASEKTRQAFVELRKGKYEDKELGRRLEKAFREIAENPRRFIQVPWKQVPKTYVQSYGIDNLYKYDLPDGWRLLYSIVGKEVEVIAVILE